MSKSQCKEKNRVAQCRLCLQSAKLCHSHIIPEFMYKPLYDSQEHRFYPITENLDAPKHYKKGIREYLLCTECESKLNTWETYFTQLRAARIRFVGYNNQSISIASGIDYTKFKLFQMSLIWRAGISQHPDFININLGPHTNTLRQMIYDSNPGEPWEYGCILFFTPSYADIFNQIIMLGEASRFDGHRCYSFILAGFKWTFIVSTKVKYIHDKFHTFLDKNGTLPLIVEDNVSKKYLERKLNDMVEISRRRMDDQD